MEGSFRSHQVPLMAAKSDEDQLKQLQKWLLSYKPAELFKKNGAPVESILSIIPEDDEYKIGKRKESYSCYEPLTVADWKVYGVEKGSQASCMQTIAKLLDQVIVDNPKSIRIF